MGMLWFGVLCLVAFCLSRAEAVTGASTGGKGGDGAHEPWRGVHITGPAFGETPLLKRAIAEVFSPMGVNVLILQVDYRFDYESHPELREGDCLTAEQARDLAALCGEHNIRLIPQFMCLGHQSWKKKTGPLLRTYPEFDETPEVPEDNEGIYCRSWCPLHPEVNPIVFALMDELIEAFQADALHVGMDEVFLIAGDQCPRCKGKDTARLFAKAVNDYHAHLVGQRNVEMLMWGDRLLDDAQMKYGEWESSRNDTAPAVDMIPRDIIICDWHYKGQDVYPSVSYFQEKGFRVWPAPWQPAKNAEALLAYSRTVATERMLGHLCTNWVSCGEFCRALLPDQGRSGLSENALEAAEALRACMEKPGE